MNTRALRRYIDDLLRGRRPKPFRPDDFEAAQIRTAIDLQAARRDSDAPSEDFLTDLHRRLAAQQDGPERPAPVTHSNRRNVIVGTSAAAAAAVAAVSIDRALIDGQADVGISSGPRELTPNVGSWKRVAASADLIEGGMRSFDVGSVIGFVRRVDGKVEAVSGVCTHQGCRLWFDAPDNRLRCPCHSTSFNPAGQVLTHQLPIAPKPLPTLMVREHDGVIDVFVSALPNQQA